MKLWLIGLIVLLVVLFVALFALTFGVVGGDVVCENNGIEVPCDEA